MKVLIGLLAAAFVLNAAVAVWAADDKVDPKAADSKDEAKKGKGEGRIGHTGRRHQDRERGRQMERDKEPAK